MQKIVYNQQVYKKLAMAIKKKPITKRKKPTTKKPKTKPLLDFNRIQKLLKEKYDKNKVLYKTGAIIALILVLVFSLFWFNKGLFLAGTINGTLITTPEFYSKLSKANGEDVFDLLVQETLINQKAISAGVLVTEEEVNEKIKELEEQLGGAENLEQALLQNNTNVEEVKKQIITQIKIEKLLNDKLVVSDDEINKYIKENKEFNPDISKEEAKEAIKSSKLNEKFNTWLEELRRNAKINTYF